MKIRVGSRQSDLAKVQAYKIERALKESEPRLEIEFHFKKSFGDRNLDRDLRDSSEKGVFTKDLTEDLLNGVCDCVVHSWKDLPTQLEGLNTKIVATLPRADARDFVLVKRSSVERICAEKSLTILSSSPRREYHLGDFLKNHLPWQIDEVKFEVIRGNIPTRFNRWLENKSADGFVVAKAALDRLLEMPDKFPEIGKTIKDILDNKAYWCVVPLSECPCASAQGAIAVEIREGDTHLEKVFQKINSSSDFQDVLNERKTLSSFGGGCQQKIGCYSKSYQDGRIEFLSGETESGQELFQRSFVQKERESPKFSKSELRVTRSKDLFKREAMKVDRQMPASRALLVSHSKALPPEWDSQLKNKFVWVSGSKTWKKLAQRGVWVNGSLDSLGEKDFCQNIESLGLGDAQKWTKLSHHRAPSDKIFNTPTYCLVETDKTDWKPNAKMYYWLSLIHI